MDKDDPEKQRPRLGAKFVRALAIVCVAGGAYYFAVGCFNYIAVLRTPTVAATIAHCDNDTTCYGTWGAGGTSRIRRIYGDIPGTHPVGSRVDVYIWRGQAYAGHPSRVPAVLLLSGSSVAIVAGGVLWWSVRRKYGTGKGR
ncbi:MULTISPECIES: hypothetical protein [unclassified Mycobacterium]|uniref:hypothetical protein n=1 Tax=unclassified Mycobacterium TaxID=2642494 RepID=UPI0007FBCB10|nr:MULTISPECIES: hypothetical protein [unclassified Mycobacterium]OBH04388.1 hypothetical protein A5696_05070 [Mycobacterium sp. E2699]OBI53749.1 hypothetical protein A5705_02280 [Mycobacterium sp. E787]